MNYYHLYSEEGANQIKPVIDHLIGKGCKIYIAADHIGSKGKEHFHIAYAAPGSLIHNLHRGISEATNVKVHNKIIHGDKAFQNTINYVGKYLKFVNPFLPNEQDFRMNLPLDIPRYNYEDGIDPEECSGERGMKRPKNKTSNLIQYCMENGITERTSFDLRPIEEIQDFLNLQGLNGILATAFQFVSAQLTTQKLFLSLDNLPLLAEAYRTGIKEFKIPKFLRENQLFSEEMIAVFGRSLIDVINRKSQKKNCVWVWGASNAGKSGLMASLCDHFFKNCYGVPQNNVRSAFTWNNCINKRIILWEEPQIIPEMHEDLKKVFEGKELSCEVKYQSNVRMQPTPVIITSNASPRQALQTDTMDIWDNRMFTWKFNYPVMDETIFPITKEDWNAFGMYLFKFNQ